MVKADREVGDEGFTESEAHELAKGFEEHDERRGNFKPRMVLVQSLGQFGAPNRAVLVGEREREYTLASPKGLREGERILIFDDNAPEGARDVPCVVTSTRLANRPGDEKLKLTINYAMADDPAAELELV